MFWILALGSLFWWQWIFWYRSTSVLLRWHHRTYSWEDLQTARSKVPASGTYSKDGIPRRRFGKHHDLIISFISLDIQTQRGRSKETPQVPQARNLRHSICMDYFCSLQIWKDFKKFSWPHFCCLFLFLLCGFRADLGPLVMVLLEPVFGNNYIEYKSVRIKPIKWP